jgi:hypothetical protein
MFVFARMGLPPQLGYNELSTLCYFSVPLGRTGLCRYRVSRVVWSDAGIPLLRVLFALMFMALPSLQAKAADAVSTPATPPASAGAAILRTEQITGTGGTFPAPVYAKWADTARSAIGVDVTYNAIGSGAGQDQIISRSVDFGALTQRWMMPGSVPPNCCSSPRSSALWW